MGVSPEAVKFSWLLTSNLRRDDRRLQFIMPTQQLTGLLGDVSRNIV